MPISIGIMIRFIAILSIVIAGAAEARVPLHPPAEFVHPYPGPFEEWSLPIREVRKNCVKFLGHRAREARGCAVYRGMKCLIIYPNTPYRGIDPLDIRRHELAHCNGWKH